LIEIFLYGGTGDDYFKGLIQAEDGGYFCYGYSNSSDQDLPGNHGDGFDLWVIKIDELYNLEWSKNVGSSSSEVNDYGALTASSNSLNFFSTVIVHSDLPNGDLACGTLGVNKKDAWLLSFDLSTNVINKFNGQQPLNTYPNPIIDQLFIENVTEELLELNLTIYNLNGVAVFSVNEYVKDTIHIDLSKLISGVYYFVYRSKDFFFSETKVIQKI
jgi:hypothetical protein